MSQWAWALVAIGAAGAGILGVFLSLPEPKAAPSARAEARTAAPPHLSERPTPTVVVMRDAAPPPSPREPTLEAAPLAASEKLPTPEQRLFELQQRFEQDGLPDARAYQVGRDVRVELERALQGNGTLQAVDCKLKTCRASMSLSDITADSLVFERILATGEGPFASFPMRAERTTGADGKVETLLFFFM